MDGIVLLTQFFSLGCMSQEDEVYVISNIWNINSLNEITDPVLL